MAMTRSDLDAVLMLLSSYAESRGLEGRWLDILEKVLTASYSSDAHEESLKIDELPAILLHYAIRAEDASTQVEADQVCDNLLQELLHSSAVRHDLVSVSTEFLAGKRLPAKWTVAQIMDAKFYKWGDYGVWRNYFMDELNKLDLPHAVWQPIYALVVEAYNPMIREAPNIIEDSKQDLFLFHFWRGDRFVEFHEWVQWLNGHDNLSIPGMGPARTRVLKHAFAIYLLHESLKKL